MKNFSEWQRERRQEAQKLGKILCLIYLLSLSIFFLGHFARIPAPIIAAIPGAMLTLQFLIAGASGVGQWRKYIQRSRAEKLEMEQRFAREDAELNATILMPHNVEVR